MWKKSKPEEKTQDLYQYNVDKKFSLSQQIVILIVLVVGVALLPASIFTTQRVAKVIYDRVSINAVSINNILCNSEEVKSVLQMQNMLPEGSKNIAADEQMMAYVNEVDNSDEAAVAIYDKYMQLRGLYNPRGLKGFEESAHALVEEYAPKKKISWRDNYAIPNKALGFVRGDDNETTIGYVVTGYSDDTLNKSTIDSVMFLMLMTFLGILMGVVGAIFLASRIKAVLFGYEPEEIARLLQERNIILDSVREGIITINGAGIITMVNDEAHQLLKQSGIDRCDKLCNSPSKLIFDDPRLEEVTRDGRSFFDASTKIGKTVFIVTAVPLVFQKNVIGAVITFRKKSVVEEMANQLTGFKNYATALRAQTHEFMNKMHVIMGLIDMKAYDELKNFTQEIAYNRQSEVSYIVTRMRDITLSGFILGKISRSRELQIDFSMTEESELHSDLEVPSVHDIVLIAGNFVENAFDVLKNYDGERIVNLSILDFDKEIVIIVEDSGPGMTEEVMSKMFDRGFSTKEGSDRGFGLYLVKQSVDNLNGTITVDSALGEGTTFTVRLPMKKEGEEND